MKTILLAAVTLLLSMNVLAKEPTDKPNPIVEYRYVGLTTGVTNGRIISGALIGVPAMNAACADEFGAGARGATFTEALFWRDDGSTDPRFGWLAPGDPIKVVLDSQGMYMPIDATTGWSSIGPPRDNPSSAYGGTFCHKYTNGTTATAQGPVILENGIATADQCTQTHPVACSAPFAIPVR